ncbi:MAG: hypothetical protein PHX18_05120 [Candidatus Gastranaerophilales bacterium]|nr:hypothetical protein [Candidatus Gastranaerophilales bacterium]
MFFDKDKQNNTETKDIFVKSTNKDTSANPFKNPDRNFFIIFEKLKKEAERLDNSACKNTYIWIEKFKEDNY